MNVRGLAAALNSNGRYAYKKPEFAVDYLVVGGGVVGLAIARQLVQSFPSKATFLVERHDRAGEEISSRNSEVVHAGLYYPADSLKTRLCIRGRHLMYEYCQKHNVPHKKVGKLVVARDDQRPYIEGLHDKAGKMGWPRRSPPSLAQTPALPTHLINGEQARELEPDLSKSIVAALWSPETGIVDSHELMDSFEANITDGGGEVAYQTRVVRVDPYKPDASSGTGLKDSGWVVQTVTGEGDSDAMLARTVINCSGLAAHLILNSLLPKESRIPMYYGRGSYASYRGPGIKNVSHLIYPCPDTGRTVHGFQSLGTHLTLDMQGKIKFGPDLDWLQPSSQDDGDIVYDADPDFWQSRLIPDESRMGQMIDAVKQYLPEINPEGFQPDYCGVRPKLVGPQGGFRDFEFHTHYPHTFLGPHMDPGRSRKPMISLLGIESPGLTSSLAIAEKVVEDMLCGENGQATE
ncbi:NAD dehydrogenase [Rhodofomes roseus]|uniref:L-2-hydroxyglutarate dehydrogenase, mitochondrial n=1 Tax=Rhodofomes roseus TaxID=34475 RepID=A0ABQ8KX45_9APHY|nr:NAD dehydrogenase [Rhodofomes roseus]KAH9843870.1 NAD dehydrogenase [Rhodofomes roseus]